MHLWKKFSFSLFWLNVFKSIYVGIYKYRQFFFYQSWKLKNWIAKNWFFVKLILFCQIVMLMYNFFHCVCTFCESHLGKILGNNKETKHTLTKWNPFTCVHVYQLSSKYIKYNPQTATHIFILTLIFLPFWQWFFKMVTINQNTWDV